MTPKAFIELPPETCLFKYMRVERFYSFIENGIFIPNSFLFDDTLEGTYTEAHWEAYQALINSQKANSKKQVGDDLKEFFKREELVSRSTAFITCWRIDTKLSEKMWLDYAGNNGVAIRTTVGRLSDCFGDSMETAEGRMAVYMGKIRYLDESELIHESLGRGNTFDLIVSKRLEFEPEREYRTVLAGQHPNTKTEWQALGQKKHVVVPIDLHKLIDELNVMPKELHPELESRLIERGLAGIARTYHDIPSGS